MGDKNIKLALFSKGDDKFIGDIANKLSAYYDIQKITINMLHMEKLEEWMNWADICWFEWCDELLVYATRLNIAKEKKIICRLHSYEAFTNYPARVNWDCVDSLIFVSETIRKYAINTFGIDEKITTVIPNGVDLSQFNFANRNSGFNVAYAGYINYKKGPMLLLQVFKALYDCDNRYNFYIAGQFQDPRYSLYFKQMVTELGLEKNYYFEGWQKNLDKWLEDKNYILCTSVLESQNMSVMQAMAKGIKPVIHNFVGASEIYPHKYLWNTVNEATLKIKDNEYDSDEYRNFVADNYSLDMQLKSIISLLEDISARNKHITGFDYKNYWIKRLNSKFDIEGVGFMGLGEIYNQFLYKNRINLLDAIVNKLFDNMNSKRVLELGPGTGIFTKLFHNNKVAGYKAVDISEKSVSELSKAYPGYLFKNGDISDQTYYSGKYDLIFAADVLLHLTDETRYKRVLENISIHLDTNGFCIILDPISVLQVKSKSPHMVIRDRDYVENILEAYGLELVEMLPVSYFMNYPFDKDLAGKGGEAAMQLFNTLPEIFKDSELSNDEKNIVGEYLMLKDRQLTCTKNMGLTEKLLIIKKKTNPCKISIKLEEIYDTDSIRERIALIEKQIKQNQKLWHKFSGKADILRLLEKDYNPTFEYIHDKMNEFISYETNNFDTFDFTTAKVIIGKREKFNRYELIEFILNNSQDKKLIINNIWYDLYNKVYALPQQIKNSKNSDEILSITSNILKKDAVYKNNIAGFISDLKIKAEVEQNYLAYMWERGIPASQFLPLNVYLKIAERYTFASGFMSNESRVLEAPCGFGYGAAYLSKVCNSVEAIDIADDNIRFAKQAYRQSNVHWNTGDVTCLPYHAGEFDVYVSFEVFEHLTVDMTVKHVEEAYRVLKKSGKFIISTPNKAMRRNVHNPFHIKEYEFEEFSTILNKVFDSVEFYSVENYKVEKGIKRTAYNMIAVCEK
ncbi:methyltransferase domain-containing protein [Clostridium sp. BNL1100]|uniref:methyltransferase domain-containing protein n=1 Tax=Clostridium sp. BNL1100 TaxID=755731 RepID=UPI00031787D0|nr:methyltransferase domain-containing protein [Clostridium sp. BNL1100]